MDTECTAGTLRFQAVARRPARASIKRIRRPRMAVLCQGCLASHF